MSLLNLHLGDNADVNDGDFANTTYVGLSVALPLRMLNPSKRTSLSSIGRRSRPWPTGKPMS
jgi:hypothetical protein